MTAPKVGDHVRCTLGDSVLVGAVEDTEGGTIAVGVERVTDGIWLDSGWQVEVLPPPIPEWLTVPGARAYTDDAVMIRRTHHWEVLNVDFGSGGFMHIWKTDAAVAALDPQPIPPAEKP